MEVPLPQSYGFKTTESRLGHGESAALAFLVSAGELPLLLLLQKHSQGRAAFVPIFQTSDVILIPAPILSFQYQVNYWNSLVSFLPSHPSSRFLGRVSGEDENAFVLVKHVYSVNTYSRISTVPRGSERSE